MKKFVLLFFTVVFLLVQVKPIYADDPNNKVGVHILFPSEIDNAARLVNSKGGDWGYVTLPIQSGDKNIEKWQSFFDKCAELHIIPIIRLATEGDYFNTQVWRKPTPADVLDFANFLNSLTWPTKTKYIVVYNEVNRDNEWGGKANASEYTQLLSYAVSVFKSRSSDFFIISAGMDNAAANSATAINEYDFYKQMNQSVPGIFNQIDGISSHSYPNPGFSQPPQIQTDESVTSFQYESKLIDSLSSKQLPIFITETGWTRSKLPDSVIAQYFTTAFSTVWNDDRIKAVTPFLLEAGTDPFSQFSLLTSSGSSTLIAQAIMDLPKTKGEPATNSAVLAADIHTESTNLPTENFAAVLQKPTVIAQFFANMFRMYACATIAYVTTYGCH